MTRTYLHGICGSWVTALALWWAWGSIPRLIAWCVLFAIYLGLMLWHLIELDHIELRLLPQPLNLIGLSERGDK